MSTRQATPVAVLAHTNSRKRALSEDNDSDANPDTKKAKRKKRKKKKKKAPVVAPISTTSVTTTRESPPPRPTSAKGKQKATSEPPVDALISESSSIAIARLNQELSAQATLLKKHESLLAQLSQSLTCQICLDPLHKPYSLSPCGHVACYNCLVQWFTSEPEQEHEALPPRKKTCPHCRARIRERPAEAWTIKDMVAGLVKSGLGAGLSQVPPPPPALPGPPPENENTSPDPWHNIFGYPHQHPRFQPLLANGEQPSIEDMGMLDTEDGGVYRCLDCMHEIWDGVCSSCNRVYPGHQVGADFEEMFDEDGESFDGEGDLLIPHWFPMHINFDAHDSDDDESLRDLEENMEDEDGYDILVISDDDEEDNNGQRTISDNDSEPIGATRRNRSPVSNRSDDDEEGEDFHGYNRQFSSPGAEERDFAVFGDYDDEGGDYSS
ncbi:hypothetical protein C8F01DRAFT_1152909 [Mycena amicta]|nr:hypothetical protein C8F01DRAFT_1152909 [Mycena amicta]